MSSLCCGGDDGRADPPGTDPPRQSLHGESSGTENPRGRGPARCDDIPKLIKTRGGRRLDVLFDRKGKSYSAVGPFAKKYSSALGMWTRATLDPGFGTFREVPLHQRVTVKTKMLDWFELDYSDHIVNGVVEYDVSKRYSDWKYDCGVHYDNLIRQGYKVEDMKNHIPVNIVRASWQWESFITFRQTEVAQAASERNKKNRSSSNYIPSLHGRKSMPQHRTDDSTPLELWRMKHQRETEWVTEKAKQAYDLMLAAMEKLFQESQGSEEAQEAEMCGLSSLDQALMLTADQMIFCMQEVLGYRRDRVKGVGRRLPRSITGGGASTFQSSQPSQPSTTSSSPQVMTEDEQRRKQDLAERQQWQQQLQQQMQDQMANYFTQITQQLGVPMPTIPPPMPTIPPTQMPEPTSGADDAVNLNK